MSKGVDIVRIICADEVSICRKSIVGNRHLFSANLHNDLIVITIFSIVLEGHNNFFCDAVVIHICIYFTVNRHHISCIADFRIVGIKYSFILVESDPDLGCAHGIGAKRIEPEIHGHRFIVDGPEYGRI